ncbi:iron ABC transporter substrate-binding protein [Ureaplasma urealyticum]|nr:iron ABC transporter substrate-binding protein [Ureaplasma urealyticum]
MKLKYKKILLVGLVAAIGLASATAIITSCKDTKKNNSNNPTTKFDLESRRKDYAEGLKFWLNGGKTSLGTKFEKVITESSQIKERLSKNQKLGTTRDSGSLVQDDAAYSFGIAPDYVHYRWNSATIKDAVPEYLRSYYNENLTKGDSFKNATADKFANYNIGVLLVADSKVASHGKLLEASGGSVGGLLIQSRSTGYTSKAPADIEPNFLFGNQNPYVAEKESDHAGRPNYFVDPFSGLITTGKTLDRIYDAKKFNNVHNATINGKTGFNSFEEYAQVASDIARKNFSNWAKSNNEWKGKTVLNMMSNPQDYAGFLINPEIKTDVDKFNVGNVFIPQPVYFPGIYAAQDDPFTPGLGAKFPLPLKNINQIQSYVDDYGWIGGKTLVGDSNKELSKTISPTIGDAFENTTDIVIYSYNEYLIEGFEPGTAKGEEVLKKFETNLANYVNGLTKETKNQFVPTKVLKEKPVVGKNFFIERKGKFYDACYGFAGQDLVVNTLNKWTRGANAQNIDLGYPIFNKNTVKHSRDFKNSLGVKVLDEQK